MTPTPIATVHATEVKEAGSAINIKSPFAVDNSTIINRSLSGINRSPASNDSSLDVCISHEALQDAMTHSPTETLKQAVCLSHKTDCAYSQNIVAKTTFRNDIKKSIPLESSQKLSWIFDMVSGTTKLHL